MAAADPMFEALQRLQSLMTSFHESLSQLCKDKSSESALDLRKNLMEYYHDLHKALQSWYETLNIKEENPEESATLGNNKDNKTSNVQVIYGLKTICDNVDGGGLVRYIVRNMRDEETLRKDLSVALSNARDPAKLALKALQGYNFSKFGIRWACLLILEYLFPIFGNDDSDTVPLHVKNSAREIAKVWRNRMNRKSALDSNAFLQLLISFRIGADYEKDELLEILIPASSHKQAPELCRSLGLFPDADFLDKVSKNLGPLDVLRFAHAFGMMEKVDPVGLLTSFLRDEEKDITEMRAHNPDASQILWTDADIKKMGALKSVINHVEMYGLQCDSFKDNLQNELRKLEVERKRREKARRLERTKKAAAMEKEKQNEYEEKAPEKKAQEKEDREKAGKKAQEKEDGEKAGAKKAQLKEDEKKAAEKMAQEKEDGEKAGEKKVQEKEDGEKAAEKKAQEKEDRKKAAEKKAQEKEHRKKAAEKKAQEKDDRKKDAEKRAQEKEDGEKAAEKEAQEKEDREKAAEKEAQEKEDGKKAAEKKAQLKDDQKKAAEKKAHEKEDGNKAAEKKAQEKEDQKKAAEKNAQEKKDGKKAAEKKAQEKDGKIATAQEKKDGEKTAEKNAQEKKDGQKAAEKKACAKEDGQKAAEKKAEAKEDTKKAAEKKAEAKEDTKKAAEKKVQEKEGIRKATEKKSQEKEDGRKAAEHKAQEKEDGHKAAEQKAQEKEDRKEDSEKKAQYKRRQSFEPDYGISERENYASKRAKHASPNETTRVAGGRDNSKVSPYNIEKKVQYERRHSFEPGDGFSERENYASKRAKHASPNETTRVGGGRDNSKASPYNIYRVQNKSGIIGHDHHPSAFSAANRSSTGLAAGAFTSAPSMAPQINDVRRRDEGYPSALGTSNLTPMGSSLYSSGVPAGAFSVPLSNVAKVNYEGRGEQSYMSNLGEVNKNHVRALVYGTGDLAKSFATESNYNFEGRGQLSYKLNFGEIGNNPVRASAYAAGVVANSSATQCHHERRGPELYTSTLGGGLTGSIGSSVYGSNPRTIPSSNVNQGSYESGLVSSGFGSSVSSVPPSSATEGHSETRGSVIDRYRFKIG